MIEEQQNQQDAVQPQVKSQTPVPEPLTVSIEDHVAVITLNNPPVNALSRKVLKGLSDAMDRLKKDSNAKVIVITGTGMFFVAGADIKEIAGGGKRSAKRDEQHKPSFLKNIKLALLKNRTMEKFFFHFYGKKAALMGQSLFYKIETMPKPVIAAINGICLGGGMELAMACHLRIASERAQLGQPEIKLGIIPGFGGTQRLPRLLGRTKALEYLLTGENIPVALAKSLGLVNDVVPDGEVLRHAKGLGRRIASMGGVGIASILKAVIEGTQKPILEGLCLEADLFGDICTTEDMKEGLKAFIEKRQPKFQDK